MFVVIVYEMDRCSLNIYVKFKKLYARTILWWREEREEWDTEGENAETFGQEVRKNNFFLSGVWKKELRNRVKQVCCP